MGIFLDKWKVATITPLFKAGNKKSVSNYQPISLLPVISKIMEKLIYPQLYSHLRDTKFFAEEQNGFRPNRDTTDSLSRLLIYIYSSLNQHQTVSTVFVI